MKGECDEGCREDSEQGYHRGIEEGGRGSKEWAIMRADETQVVCVRQRNPPTHYFLSLTRH